MLEKKKKTFGKYFENYIKDKEIQRNKGNFF